MTQPGFWREVFDHLGAGVAVLDSSDRIIAVNPAAEELLGRTASAMSGQDFHVLLHRHVEDATLPQEPCRLLTALTRRLRARGADTLLSEDGHLIPVTWFSDPVTRNGEALGMIVLMSGDGTDREAAVSLAAHVTALEDLTDRLALAAEIATALAQTLDTEEALARLGRLLVPRLADWIAIDLRTDEGVRRLAVIGPESRDTERDAWQGPLPALDEHSRSSLVRVLRGGDPVLMGLGGTSLSHPTLLWPPSRRASSRRSAPPPCSSHLWAPSGGSPAPSPWPVPAPLGLSTPPRCR
ncbi:PAS domain S-box protein [Nonomuraea salmonea]|uniref:PAS domain S-box protein n=1 Tax=Nonomuraea salmonea TaxID=46181 RepID=UPI0031E59AAB